MDLCWLKTRKKLEQGAINRGSQWRLSVLPMPLLLAALMAMTLVVVAVISIRIAPTDKIPSGQLGILRSEVVPEQEINDDFLPNVTFDSLEEVEKKVDLEQAHVQLNVLVNETIVSEANITIGDPDDEVSVMEEQFTPLPQPSDADNLGDLREAEIEQSQPLAQPSDDNNPGESSDSEIEHSPERAQSSDDNNPRDLSDSEIEPSPPFPQPIVDNPGEAVVELSSPLPQPTIDNPGDQVETVSDQVEDEVEPSPSPPQPESSLSPYHNWEIFAADYEVMLRELKIYVYPDAYAKEAEFSNIFVPHPNSFHDTKAGNYFSEHAFKVALLGSPLVTKNPEDATFFFLPFSINLMRNDPRLHSASSITDFVASYTNRISSEFPFWNASRGANHFYACCHSIGRTAMAKHPELHDNAIQVACSSNYFQRFYVSHKDVALPQVWPRQEQLELKPPDKRNRLAFFAGRMQNAIIRQELFAKWGNDSSMDIFSGSPSIPYDVAFSRSKFCLHVKGYEVNTARVTDAIHYGCIPVLISDYYELPLAKVLDWSKFSIIIMEKDIASLKKILLSIPRNVYLTMYENVLEVRKHFVWNSNPKNYDSFYMTVYQLWLRRGLHRLSY